MFWYRLELSLGRNSLVGTTVRRADIPQDLLADEHHQPLNGQMHYVATVVGGDCCLGAHPATGASRQELIQAYQSFKTETLDVHPQYAPKTVNTDGWKATQAAWATLFPMITIIQCFLHAWLAIRDRAKHLKSDFREIGDRVWDAYRAPNRRSFAQRLRRLRSWATQRFTGPVLEKIQKLCDKRSRWAVAYDEPCGYRTSNSLDRLMRAMNQYFDKGNHFHGSLEAATQHCRAWALLHNFAPWSPQARDSNDNYMCPAHRLNQFRYHESWLQNLLISASLGGYGPRNLPPQNAV